MNIGFFSHTYLPRVGGKELATHSLAKELSARGHDVRVFVGRGDRGCPREEIIEGVAVHRLVPDYMFVGRRVRLHGWVQYALRVVWEFSAVLRQWQRFRMDIAHMDLRPDLALCVSICAAIKKTPFVAASYGSDLLLLHTRPRFHEWIVKFALSRARRVITVSRKLREVAVSLVPTLNGRVEVIHAGVDLSFFEGFKSSPRLVEGPYIVSIGRMHYVKGRDVLLRAFAKVLAKQPNCRVVLTGEGEILQQLHELAGDLEISDRVLFWGEASRQEVAVLLHGCELSVLPSRSEGLPLAIIESFACSKPVVASRVGGVAEIVEDLRNGILVEPEDEDGLAKAIVTLLSDPNARESMGECGYLVARDHDWQAIAKDYARVFEGVLATA